MMNKPTIALDIDDVLVSTAGEIIDAYNAKWNTRLKLADWYSDVGPQWGTPDKAVAIRRVNEYIESDAYFDLVPVRDAALALKELSKRFELHVLTGRPEVIAGATQKWLQRHFPDMLRSVNFSNMFDEAKKRSKGEMCRELGASYLIDDHLENCVSAAGVGIKAVLFGSYPWNQSVALPNGVTRCIDWDAVLEYSDGTN